MSNTKDNDLKVIPEFIKRAIQTEVEKATQEELTEAQKRIDKRKLEIVSAVMLSVNKYMTMESVQQHTYKFVIEIK